MTTVVNSRSIDELGRIVLPKAIREHFGICSGDQFKVEAEGNKIVLERYATSCLACEDNTDVQLFNRTVLCGECRDAVGKTL